MLNRREALERLAGTAWVSTLIPAGRSFAAGGKHAESTQTGLGLVLYSCRLRRELLLKSNPECDLFAPGRFLEHCRALGAGGMQIKLDGLTNRDARALRAAAEDSGRFIEAAVTLPEAGGAVDEFRGQLRTAAEAGALAARTVIMPGRRYEQFRTLDEYREFARRGRRALERAAPMAEQFRIPLAVENHKDQRIDERVALFESIGSEYVGACVDTGNSIALLDDPMETVAALAPWAHAVHLKDQALASHADGFLLGDIPLGQGCLDLRRMVDVLKQRQPKIRFALELITRDALKVPCLTAEYWATMPQVRATELARILRMVRQHGIAERQNVSALPLEEQVQLEDANVAASLKYAREVLEL